MSVVGWAVAGLLAGLVMSAWRMAEESLAARGMWRAPNLVASILLGARAIRGDFALGTVGVGMALHLATSAAMGVLFGLLAEAFGLTDVPGAVTVGAAVGYALLGWLLWQYLLMPWLAPEMGTETQPASLAVANGVYGLALGLISVLLD